MFCLCTQHKLILKSVSCSIEKQNHFELFFSISSTKDFFLLLLSIALTSSVHKYCMFLWCFRCVHIEEEKLGFTHYKTNKSTSDISLKHCLPSDLSIWREVSSLNPIIDLIIAFITNRELSRSILLLLLFRLLCLFIVNLNLYIYKFYNFADKYLVVGIESKNTHWHKIHWVADANKTLYSSLNSQE